jgi:hypothetical protein
MSKVALEYSVPGPKKNVLSMVPASVRWMRAGPSSLSDSAYLGTATIQNRPDWEMCPLKS